MSLSTACTKAPTTAPLALSATAATLGVALTSGAFGPGPQSGVGTTVTPTAAVLTMPGTNRLEKRAFTVVVQGEIAIPTAPNGGVASATTIAIQLGSSTTPGNNVTLGSITGASQAVGTTKPFLVTLQLFVNDDGGFIDGNMSGQIGSTVVAKTAITELAGAYDAKTEGAVQFVVAASAGAAASNATVTVRDFYLEN